MKKIVYIEMPVKIRSVVVEEGETVTEYRNTREEE